MEDCEVWKFDWGDEAKSWFFGILDKNVNNDLIYKKIIEDSEEFSKIKLDMNAFKERINIWSQSTEKYLKKICKNMSKLYIR